MNELLVPSAEFTPEELGRELFLLVTSPWTVTELKRRRMYGVLYRYGRSPESAAENVARGQQAEQPQHWVAVHESGNVMGTASDFESLPLEKSRLGVSRRLINKAEATTKTPLLQAGLRTVEQLAITAYPHATNNVEGWVAAHYRSHLPWLYQALTEPYKQRLTTSDTYVWTPNSRQRPWTIESTGSPDYVHEAIQSSGLTELATDFFDDQEGGRRWLGRSVLYGLLHFNADNGRHGRLEELRTGEPSRLGREDIMYDQMAGANPIGFTKKGSF